MSMWANSRRQRRIGSFQHRNIRLGRRARGVTLVELLVALVIIAILASFAFPAYSGYVTRSKRALAKSTLLTVADLQEQFFTDNKRYASKLTEIGYAADLVSVGDDGNIGSKEDPDRIYLIGLGNTSNTTYTALAAPVLNQAEQDAACKILSLTHTGVRGNSGPANDCW